MQWLLTTIWMVSLAIFAQADVKSEINNTMNKNTMEEIVLGGGCFWCIEAVFEEVEGVKEVISGYAGGKRKNPSYEQVASGATGHAEVCKVVFDPREVQLKQLLEIFFTVHDPTQLNRQGPDTGRQYRSIVLYKDEKQKQITEEVIGTLTQSGTYEDPIVTEVAPLEAFYEAEPYHQDYFAKNPYQGYCTMFVRPKIKKFKTSFPQLVK